MAREYPRCSLTDAGCPPGYDGDFAGQPLSWFHVSPVLSSTSQVALGSRDGQRWTGSQGSPAGRGTTTANGREEGFGPLPLRALIRKALAQFGVERPIIVAHSWGVLFALAHAVDHRAPTLGPCCCSPATTSPPGGSTWSSPHCLPSRSLAICCAIRSSSILAWITGPIVLKKLFEPSKGQVKRDFPFSMALRPSQIRATAEDAVQMVPAATSLARHYGQLTMRITIMAGRGDKIVAISP